MLRKVIRRCILCTLFAFSQSYAQDAPIGNYSLAADGWYEGKVQWLLVNDSGLMRVGLNPEPSEQGINCAEMPNIQAHSSFSSNSEEARWARTRLYEAFADAMEKNATVSVYLKEITLNSGEIGCYAQRVQVWATQDSPTTQPTQPGQSGQPTQPTSPPATINYYGALAVSNQSGASLVWNHQSQSSAQNAALQGCRDSGGTGCRIVANSGNGQCISFARDSNTGAWGSAVASDLQSAQTAALSSCRRQEGSNNCVVELEGCNGSGTSSRRVMPSQLAIRRY